jgi:hypothetical protein
MLGDLGELVACLEFGLTPLPTNSRGVDAKTPNDEGVEVKATAGESVWIPGVSPTAPKYAVVVKFSSDGSWVIPFHGTLEALWRIDAELGGHNSTLFTVKRLARITERLSAGETLSTERPAEVAHLK